MNPLVLMASLALGVLFAIRNINKAARGLANDLGMGRDQLEGQLVALKAQEIKFQAIGLDADKLKTTLTTLSTEFKDLELVTAENAANYASPVADNFITPSSSSSYSHVL